MTTEEAKTKWCPFARREAVRYLPEGREEFAGSFNRYCDGAPAVVCLADACMVWVGTDSVAVGSHEEVAINPDTGRRSLVRVGDFAPAGYCGLSRGASC